MKESHGEGVYTEFRNRDVWTVVDQAINDLVENQDLNETTAHELIVGYIVKALVEADQLKN